MKGAGRWGTASLILMSLVIILIIFPVPYVRGAPGPTYDVLGQVEGADVLRITGTPTYPTSGNLDMTTATEYGRGTGGLSLVGAVMAWLSPNQTLEPWSMRFPEGTDPDREAEFSEAVFEASASTALAAAARYTGHPVYSEPLISGVEQDSPADGLLRPGDVIESIDGRAVTDSAEVGQAVRAAQSGATVSVGIRRDGQSQTVDVESTQNPSGGDGAYLGILLIDGYTSDFEVDLTLDGIGGPSAGLIFAIGIVDKITKTSMLGDGHVAGTGTIDADGEVGPIGSIRQKMVGATRAGATLFIAPRDNCPDVIGHVPDGLEVVAVSSLGQAVDTVESWRAGSADLPRCSEVG